MALQGSPRIDFSKLPPANITDFMGHSPLDSRIIAIERRSITVIMWFKGHDPELKNGRFVQGHTGSETVVVAQVA